MRIKYTSSDFRVEEQLDIDLSPSGDYAIYRVEKRDITTLQARTRLAASLGLKLSAVSFPALKDRHAVAVQHATIKGNPPAALQAEGVTATHQGRLHRPLQPTDIRGNRFAVTLRDLSAEEGKEIPRRLGEMADYGLPNYYDDQRFGSFHPQDGFLGAHIVRRDAEAALRAYLTVVYPGDPRPVKRFKHLAASHWGEWGMLLAAAPKPSNYRSVLTFLQDHPADYRKALNLVPRSLLSLLLEAYQSALWNQIAGRYLDQALRTADVHTRRVEIAATPLPIYHNLPVEMLDALRSMAIVLPHHRATYSDPRLADIVQEVLRHEKLTLYDLKARILKKAYLSRHHRPLLVFPGDPFAQPPALDEHFPDRLKLTISFTLPRGSYATLVARCAGQSSAGVD